MAANWDLYQSRMSSHGDTIRESVKNRSQRSFARKVKDGMFYHRVQIDGEQDERDVSIIDSDDLFMKYIYSMPGEDFTIGDMILWEESHWMITRRDPANELYTKAIMIMCNHLLKWVNDNGQICEQWSIVEDGTKYMTGEYEDRNFVATRGDSRVSLTIARTEESLKLNRRHRFLIDDPESEQKLAYSLTKPLKTGQMQMKGGKPTSVFKFILQEDATTDDDNMELGIADYYKHFPRGGTPTPPPSYNQTEGKNEEEPPAGGRRNWL